MHALVIAHGEPPARALLAELAGNADVIVAADGGVAHALKAGLRVDKVVGDLDSVPAAVRRKLPPSTFEHVRDADMTDLQKAIAWCIAQGAGSVDVVAAGGGRPDHALANLSVLRLFRGETRLRIVDDWFETTIIDGAAEVEGPPGTVVSLVAIGDATGVTTSGLRWDLDEYPLSFSPYGIHNELRLPHATISVASGDVLLFTGRWVEKHA